MRRRIWSTRVRPIPTHGEQAAIHVEHRSTPPQLAHQQHPSSPTIITAEGVGGPCTGVLLHLSSWKPMLIACTLPCVLSEHHTGAHHAGTLLQLPRWAILMEAARAHTEAMKGLLAMAEAFKAQQIGETCYNSKHVSLGSLTASCFCTWPPLCPQPSFNKHQT